MTESESGRPLLSEDEVRGWIAERHAAAARLEDLDRKLQGFRLMFPDLAERLLGPERRVSARTAHSSHTSPRSDQNMPLHEKPITDVLLILLEDEDGGRPPRWFREKMLSIPGLAERAEKTPTSINNALSRLLKRDKLRKVGESYYLPDVLERIERGELEDERREPSSTSFNALMHIAMKEYGKPFKAADAMRVAHHVPEVRAKLKEQPSRLYSWLSREVFKHKLSKDGDVYFYPSKDGGAVSTTAEGDKQALPENVTLFEPARRSSDV